MKKFKVGLEKFKKTWWIIVVIYLVIGIFVLPPLIYANFNIKTKLQGNYTILDFIPLFKDGMNRTFSKLAEIAAYSTSKIPEEEIVPGMLKISGINYILKTYLNTLIILFGIYLFSIFKNSESKDEYEDIEHGSSDWADDREIYSKFTTKKGIILAEKIAIDMDTKIKGNKNVLVVGNSGSGKSAGFVKPNVTEDLGSFVFTDPKGELFDYSAKYFESQGYDIKVLNLKNPKNSDGYNPLINVKTDIDLDIVARTIVLGQTEGSTDDPYFTDNAQVLLKALIRFLKETRPETEQNLTSCASLVRSTNASSSSQNMLLNLMQILPEDHLARKDYESVSLATDKAFSSIASTLQSLLSKFETPDIAALTSTNTIDFASIGRKKTALYVISSDTNSTFDFLLTIFFSQMLDKLYEEADNNGGSLNIPVVFFLDEFANIGKIPDFDRKIATSRSRKISFNVILQNLEQLENIYGNSYETIVGNCDTHLFLGSTSAKTLEYFSKALGEKTIKISHKNKDGEEDGGKDQKLGRYLMTPDEIRRLPYDECLIFSSGIKPIKTKKCFFFNHKELQVPDKFDADNTSYIVDRGPWNTFSLGAYQKEAQKRSMSKMIQGSLEKQKATKIIDLNEDDFKEKETKEEKKNNEIRNIIGEKEEETRKLKFNLDVNSDVPEDHIDNFKQKKDISYDEAFKETVVEFKKEEKENDAYAYRTTVDEKLKEKLNSNIKMNKYSEENILKETNNEFAFDNESDNKKEEIKRNKRNLVLKDINKEELLKKIDKDNKEKEIEKNLEKKFEKLFGKFDK